MGGTFTGNIGVMGVMWGYIGVYGVQSSRFPNIRGAFFGGPYTNTRIAIVWDLYWGPLIRLATLIAKGDKHNSHLSVKALSSLLRSPSQHLSQTLDPESKP